MLQRAGAPVPAALCAVLFCLPTLWQGLLNDDYPQQIELSAPGPMHRSLEAVGLGVEDPGRLRTRLRQLFVAVGPGKNRRQLLDYGALPCWTAPDYEVALWRPLATLTHWIDHRFFGGSVLWMHVHNLLWLAGLVLAVAGCYRRLLPAGVVGSLALVLFVLDEGHYFPAFWIANRNQLMAVCFGMLSLRWHDRWRSERCRMAAIASWFCLAASLLCAEAGIASFAYLFAYALVLDRGGWGRRLLSLVPAAGVILLWRAAYDALGYGARGGGFYVDPAGDPVAFARALLERAPFLLAGQWFSLPPELFAFLEAPARGPWIVGLWLVVLAVLAAVVGLCWRDRAARFWGLGMAAALVPVCAAVPMGRNLFFAGVGGFALAALFVHRTLTGSSASAKRLPWRCLQVLALLLLVIHGPGGLLGQLAAPWVTAATVAPLEATLDLSTVSVEPNEPLWLVNSPNPASFLYWPYRQAWYGKPLPSALVQMAPAFRALTVSRPAADRLVITARDGDLFHPAVKDHPEKVSFFRLLSDFHGPVVRWDVGDRCTRGGVTWAVAAVNQAGWPVALEIRVDHPDVWQRGRWVLWNWKTEGYEPFSPPNVGQTVTIRGPH